MSVSEASGIVAMVRTITPTLAEEWLDRDGRNRREHRGTVAMLRKAIVNGEWCLNGATIKIALDGRILDGQHRLRAILETGISVQSLVATGLSIACFDTIDAGKSRTLADCLSIEEVRNYSSVASALRWISRIRSNSIYTNKVLTSREGLSFLHENPKVLSSVCSMTELKICALLPCGVAAALHHEMNIRCAETADWMFERLGTGCNLDVHDPTHTLREKLITTKSNAKTRATSVEKMAWTIKAWNLERKQSRCRTLRWSMETREAFPVIH